MKNYIRETVRLWPSLIFFLLLGPARMLQAQTTELANLVVFVRFADDAEIDHPFASNDSMFNGKTPGYLSIYNFYDVMTYNLGIVS